MTDKKPTDKKPLADEDETNEQSIFHRIVTSKTLVKVIAFNAIFLGALVTSVVVPILPAILNELVEKNNNGTNINELISERRFSQDREFPSSTAPSSGNLTQTQSPRSKNIVVQTSYIFLAKPLAEMLTNFVTGKMVDMIGHKIPLLIGSFLSTCSIIGFAYANVPWLMTLMRVVEGVGTSFSVVSVLALVSNVFTSDIERTKAISIAYMGWSSGVAFGYPFGGITYHFFGRHLPFIFLGILTILDAFIRVFMAPPVRSKESILENSTGSDNFKSLITHRSIILILTLCLSMYTLAGVYLTVTPEWMLHSLHATMWEVGVLLCIGAVFQTLMKYFVGWYGIRVGRWICNLFGFLCLSLGFIIYTVPQTIWELVGPDFVVRIGYATGACAMTSLLALVCEQYFPTMHGTAFGLYSGITNLGFVIGPLLNIGLIKFVNTTWSLRVFGFVNLIAVCLSYFLRSAEYGEDKQPPSDEPQN